jgi:hypothetical protein
MSAADLGVAQTLQRLGLLVLIRIRDRSRAAASRIARVRPLYIVGAFVLAEWIVTLGLALAVRHNGWLYYQGGDQVWFYTTSWLTAHGHLPATSVGYGWSTLLMPFTLFGGPSLLGVLPGILLLNVFVLMPVAIVALYGIGERLGGRLFGYWILVLWIAVPFIGIPYTNLGYHQRYTELTLPHAFGLTAMSEFSSMVMLVVAAYFCLRALEGAGWEDGVLAGLFAGFGIGVKPSSALFLIGVGLAFVGLRRWRATAALLSGLAPSLAVLLFWKWRGLGYVPVFHSEQATRLAIGNSDRALGAVNLGKYVSFDWAHLGSNIDLLREHFWSGRVLQWLMVAGVIALLRISVPAFLLIGGWFLGFVLIKGLDPVGSIENASLLRMLVPAIPAFIVMLASIPLLAPHAQRLLPAPRPRRDWASAPVRRTLILAAAMLFICVPAAMAAVSHPLASSSDAGFLTQAGPLPVDTSLRLTARVQNGHVHLSWPAQHPAGARVFYQILKSYRPSSTACPAPQHSYVCTTVAATVRGAQWIDKEPRGGYEYRLVVAANWLNDLAAGGDPYVVGPPLVVRVP